MFLGLACSAFSRIFWAIDTMTENIEICEKSYSPFLPPLPPSFSLLLTLLNYKGLPSLLPFLRKGRISEVLQILAHINEKFNSNLEQNNDRVVKEKSLQHLAPLGAALRTSGACATAIFSHSCFVILSVLVWRITFPRFKFL